MRCSHCGKTISKAFTFKCKHCGGIFCSKCRLPENHKCSAKRDIKPINNVIIINPVAVEEPYLHMTTEEVEQFR
jgi:predicted nucleic acid binding AN1-type Zn finger protein